MIIDCDFLSYVIFDQQLTLLLENPQALLKTPLFTHPLPLKNSKSASPPFLLTLKVFQPPPPPCAEKGGGERTVYSIFQEPYII